MVGKMRAKLKGKGTNEVQGKQGDREDIGKLRADSSGRTNEYHSLSY